MIVVGLTGGIGSGKSTVSALLAARGAVIVDADAIVRDLQRAGQPVFEKMVERFGTGIVGVDGELDRAAVAAVVFADPEVLKELNGIVHPAVGTEIRRRVAEQATTDNVVVLDIPLLAEGDGRSRYPVAGVIVVDTPVDVAVDRLVRQRGLSEEDARARMARQVSREDRLKIADRVVDNSGDRAALEAQIDDLWAWIHTLPSTPPEAATTTPQVEAEPAQAPLAGDTAG
jgi:dephospho-CoA kinase